MNLEAMTLLHGLDLAARALAIGMLLPLVAALLRKRPVSWSSLLAALFGFGAMAYALCSQPDIESGPIWLRLVLIPLCAGNSAVLWALVVALSDEAFEPTAIHVAAWLVLAAAGGATVLAAPWAGSILAVLTLCMLGLASIAALHGLADDLSEPRRRFRVLSVTAIVIFTLATAGARLIHGSGPMPGGFVALGAVALAAVAGYVSLSMLDLSDHTILLGQLKVAPRPNDPPKPTSEDERLLALLSRSMAEERLYREPEISVASLAHRLGVPPHRLRTLVNGHLGHRNFSSYVNGIRVAEAAEALADPEQVSVPIATIALDAGFGSLTVFNRAFREKMGVTPSEHRRIALGDRSNSESD